MEEKKTIPYIAYESALARLERQSKRFFIALVIAILLMVITNGLWLYAWNQYDYLNTSVTKTVDVNAKDGVANYIGNNGNITTDSND